MTWLSEEERRPAKAQLQQVYWLIENPSVPDWSERVKGLDWAILRKVLEALDPTGATGSSEID